MENRCWDREAGWCPALNKRIQRALGIDQENPGARPAPRRVMYNGASNDAIEIGRRVFQADGRSMTRLVGHIMLVTKNKLDEA